ncbi:MAG: hypothetical protein Q8Q85_09745 [Gemmatimonadales bacterium]|nr:hypothetical protein [Gemmatimonadales bacterium]
MAQPLREALPNPACPAAQATLTLANAATRDRKTWPELLFYIGAYGLQRVEDTWKAAAKDARVRLATHGYVMAEKDIGCGHFACAYPLDNDPGYVVKLTGDFTEAAAWQRVHERGRRAPWIAGLADTPCVFALGTTYPAEDGSPRRMFAVVQERLRKLSSREQNFLDDDSFLYGRVLRCLAGQHVACAKVTAKVCGALLNDPPAFEACLEGAVLRAAQKYTKGKVTRDHLALLVNTLAGLQEIGIGFSDFHGGNVLRRPATGELCIGDLGMARVVDVRVPLVNPRRR